MARRWVGAGEETFHSHHRPGLSYNKTIMAMKIIDIHTHGIGRHETRSGKPADILGMARLHGKAGVAAIVPTVYSAGIKKMRADLGAIREAMADLEGDAGKGAAKVLGAHLEGPFLNPARSGALEKRSFIKPTITAFNGLIKGYEDVIRMITISPELPGALKVIGCAAGMGIRVSMGHSEATFAEARRAREAGATGVTHLFNAMSGLHHREPGLIGFALADPEIYVEVIADGVHVSPEILKMVFRLKRAGRIIAVSDSVKGPMRKSGVLQGGGAALAASRSLLSDIGLGQRSIALALGLNAARFLGLKSLPVKS